MSKTKDVANRLLEIDRIADAKKLAKRYNHVHLNGLYVKYMSMTLDQLNNEAKNNKGLTATELGIIKNISNSLKGEKTLDHLRYAQEKTFGKSPDVIELSGLDGKPIEIKAADTVQALDEKSLAKLKQTLLSVIKNKKGG